MDFLQLLLHLATPLAAVLVDLSLLQMLDLALLLPVHSLVIPQAHLVAHSQLVLE